VFISKRDAAALRYETGSYKKISLLRYSVLDPYKLIPAGSRFDEKGYIIDTLSKRRGFIFSAYGALEVP